MRISRFIGFRGAVNALKSCLLHGKGFYWAALNPQKRENPTKEAILCPVAKQANKSFYNPFYTKYAIAKSGQGRLKHTISQAFGWATEIAAPAFISLTRPALDRNFQQNNYKSSPLCTAPKPLRFLGRQSANRFSIDMRALRAAGFSEHLNAERLCASLKTLSAPTCNNKTLCADLSPSISVNLHQANTVRLNPKSNINLYI